MSRDIGRLAISTTPPGAYILLNDVPHGTTPQTIESLPAKPTRIVLTHPGHESVIQDVRVVPQQTTQLSVTLPPRKGHVQVSIVPWGDVYVNEQLTKRRLEGAHLISISLGEQKISIVHPAYGRWERMVEVSENGAPSFTIDFKRRITLSVTAYDTEAAFVQGEIFLNGRATGQTTPTDIEVPIGMQIIEVRAAGYEPSAPPKPINVDATTIDPLRFVLKKVESAP